MSTEKTGIKPEEMSLVNMNVIEPTDGQIMEHLIEEIVFCVERMAKYCVMPVLLENEIRGRMHKAGEALMKIRERRNRTLEERNTDREFSVVIDGDRFLIPAGDFDRGITGAYILNLKYGENWRDYDLRYLVNDGRGVYRLVVPEYRFTHRELIQEVVTFVTKRLEDKGYNEVADKRKGSGSVESMGVEHSKR